MAIDKKKLKEHILKSGKEAVEANKTRSKNLDEWTKRFEALRSTSSLDDDVKKKPWYGASNVGIPVDATVVYTLHARLIKATFGVDPAISMRPADLPYSTYLQRYINWEMWEEMRMFMDILLGYQGMLIDGDKIMKTSIDRNEVFYDDESILFLNEHDEPYMSESTGSPLEAETEEQPSIFDPKTLQEYKPAKAKQKTSRVVYYGPKVTNIPTKHIIVPADADDPDVNKIEWIIHEFWKPYGWIKQKADDNPEMFDKEEVECLKKDKDKERAIEEDSKTKTLGLELKTKTKMYKFWEWHGRYEDDKGRTHELVALVCPDEKRFLGYIPNRYYFRTGRRQFVHYTCFPMDGRFWGKGCVEWLRGVRTMIDALINMGLDKESLNGNPPLLYSITDSGFDPAEHKFGPGKSWGLRNLSPDKIRSLDIAQTQNSSMMREEMLFGIVQKLFGVTDYSLGSTTGKKQGSSSNKTASGISSIINEGNIRFDVLVRLVQEWSNPELAQQIFRHFTMNRFSIMKEKGLNKPKEIFDPIMQLSDDELNGNFEYVFKGNTSTVNPQIQQEQVSYLYDTFTKTRNPFVVDDPDVMHDMTEMMLNDYNVRGLKIKSVDEFRKMSAVEPNKAKQIQEQAIKEHMGVGQGQPELQGAGR